MDSSKVTERWDITLLMSVLVVQLVLEGYGMVANSETATFWGHLAFAALWVVFGLVAFREHGKTRLSMLTVLLLVAGGLLTGYALLATNPIIGDGVAEILAGAGALAYASQVRRSDSKPFQRA